jgi:type III restriction enzyme
MVPTELNVIPKKEFLYRRLELEHGRRNILDREVSSFVVQNLNPRLSLRPYQTEALKYFASYWEAEFADKPDSKRVLFQMATGSGKTLIMAALMLYLFDKGYRNFLFFVNSTSVIDKTRVNFLSKGSSKFLFGNQVVRNGQHIRVREVETFQSSDPNSINILFSTIQGLHSKLNNPAEGSVTYEDFLEFPVVLISDEAHHINVETKAKLSQGVDGEVVVSGSVTRDEVEELVSWETTVNRIQDSRPDNVLMEFTATADLANEAILSKYSERLIYDYQLRQFRLDGYSKDIKVLQSDTAEHLRVLQAVLLSQYRKKIFEANGIKIKPVVLFKSKTISESKSFQDSFISLIESVGSEKLELLRSVSTDPTISRMFSFFEASNISMENLALELRIDFGEERLISINSKDDSTEKQLAINSLEDEANMFRAVFAVDKLNEGWDVLNLFDIVRLYDTRDARNNIAGETTIKEAQLIGRGARYCPFPFGEGVPFAQRKFDSDLEHPLRVCEELFYHSSYNPKYIQELTSVLVSTGIVARTSVQRHSKVKPEFLKTSLFNSGLLFLNKLEKYERFDVVGLPDSVTKTVHKAILSSNQQVSGLLFDENAKMAISRTSTPVNFSGLDSRVIRKALQRLDFYSFRNLKLFYPNLESLSEFTSSSSYLGGISFVVSGGHGDPSSITNDAMISCVVQVLEGISQKILSQNIEYRGSTTFEPHAISELVKDKVMNFAVSDYGEAEFGRSMNNPAETSFHLDLSSRDWHVFEDNFGTSEEKSFVLFIDKVYPHLAEIFDSLYLLRNERFFKLFNFDDGKAFEPDYVLLAEKTLKSRRVMYQVFVEPKGSHLADLDRWKEYFLTSLNSKHRIEQIWQGKEFIIWGLPFYSQAHEGLFEKEMESILPSD